MREFVGATAADMYGENAGILKDMQRCLLERRVICRGMPYTTRDSDYAYYMKLIILFPQEAVN